MVTYREANSRIIKKMNLFIHFVYSSLKFFRDHLTDSEVLFVFVLFLFLKSQFLAKPGAAKSNSYPLSV